MEGDWTIGAMLQADFVAAPEGDAYGVDLLHTVMADCALLGTLRGYLEYAGFSHLAGYEKYRAYVNSGFTLGVSENVQLDAGVRIGLNDAAEDFGFFSGISLRR